MFSRLNLLVCCLALAFVGAVAGMPVRLRVVPGHVPSVVKKLSPAARMEGSRQLRLSISLPLRNQTGLTSLLRELYDPASPKYRRYLTSEQFAANFAPTTEDYESLIQFAQSAGLEVATRHPNRMLLDVIGSAATIEKAFGVRLYLYKHPKEDRMFYAPDEEPSVIEALPILHIGGLTDFQLPRPAGLELSNESDPAAKSKKGGPMPQIGTGPNGTFIGRDFRSAYVPGTQLTGAGQIVALVEFDGYVSNDIAAYETNAGLPTVPLTNVLIDGFGGGAGTSADEVSLDIEMAVAMAPGLSQVMVYEASLGSSPSDLLNRIATDNVAKQISSSWTYGSDPALTQIFQQFAAQGQSYFNSSGDDDAYPGPILAPADNDFATIVGGTTLLTSGAGGPWVSESVWNIKSGTGSGGGFSTSIPIPWWQTNVNMTANLGSTTMRNIPDVACVAQNIWVIYGGGNARSVSGTSCSAPLWAGLAALMNQDAVANGSPPVGFLNPALYQIAQSSNYASAFHDITAGNNTNASSPLRFFAVPGYDLCTGWGTPNGQALIDLLVPPDSLRISPVAGFAATGPIGGPFNITAENFLLTNASGAPLSWSAGGNAPWIGVFPSGGSLDPGMGTNVSVFLTNAANALPAGAFQSVVQVTNLATGLVHPRAITLNVFDPLVIATKTGFAASGQTGGPFNIAQTTFVLTNGGPQALSWAVVSNPPWLNLSPASGSLALPGSVTNIVASLNSTASNLASGNYSGVLVFSNLTLGTAQTRAASLSVGQPAVTNGDFETGTFAGWSITGNSSFVTISTDPTAAHSGKYGVQLGPPFSLGFLSQTIPTLPGRVYLISFWFDSPDGQTPSQFEVSWNGYSLFNQSDLPELGWTNIQALAAASGPGAVLQFGYRNDNSFFGLDDVTAMAVSQPPAPVFQSAAQSGTNIIVNWSAIPGAAYQVQARNSLTAGGWTNAGPQIIAASSSAGATNAITGRQQFYRVLQVIGQ
jgi:hypothetical protein